MRVNLSSCNLGDMNIDAYLNDFAGDREKYVVVKQMEDKFNLSSTEAEKIYNAWRRNFVSFIKNPDEPIDTEEIIVRYIKINRSGTTLEQIIKYIELKQSGVKCNKEITMKTGLAIRNIELFLSSMNYKGCKLHHIKNADIEKLKQLGEV